MLLIDSRDETWKVMSVPVTVLVLLMDIRDEAVEPEPVRFDPLIQIQFSILMSL